MELWFTKQVQPKQQASHGLDGIAHGITKIALSG